MPSEPSFDVFQFNPYFRSARPASAKTNISFEDYLRGMSVQTNIGPLMEVPEWANDDDKLAIVIRYRWRLFKRAKLKEGTTEKIANDAAIARAGSYKAMLAGILYRAWRLREDAATIAWRMGISGTNVRQHIHRTKLAAIKLGFGEGSTSGPGWRLLSMRKRWKDPEYKKRLRAAHRGKKLAAATRAKISAGRRRFEALRVRASECTGG